MNYLLSRTVSARIYATLTIAALLLSALPVQFNTAQAEVLEVEPTYSYTLTKKFSEAYPVGYTADQFTFSIEGTSATGTAVSELNIPLVEYTADTATAEINLPIGTYTVTENGPAGFSPGEWTVQWSGYGCENANSSSLSTTITVSDDPSGNVCTADNQWRPGVLTVEKRFGPATSSVPYGNFEFKVMQGSEVKYEGPFDASDGVNEIYLEVGDYTVVETVTGNYTPSYLNCSGSVAQGGSETCRVTNTWIDDGSVLGCTDPDANNYNANATIDDGSCTYDQGPVCESDVNLIENGDFETPTVADAAGWDIFTTGIAWITDWIAPNGDATDPASLELHAGVNGWLPSEGKQYAELDGDYQGPTGTSGEPASTKISQTVITIPGEEYTLSWDFSPRPNTGASENDLAVFIDDEQVATNTGVGGAQTDWTPDSYTFVADANETTIIFADDGNPNSEGTFVDNIALVCNPGSGGNGDGETYIIEGYVWHDENSNTEWDGFEEDGEGATSTASTTEDELTGWTVEITDGDSTQSTTTDPTGYYYFEVPAGTWTITEVLQDGWEMTAPVSGSHIVTVPEEIGLTISERIFAFLIPTAHAAAKTVYGLYNFGNVQSSGGGNGDDDDDSSSSSSSGGGGGSLRPVCESFELSESGGIYTLSWETRRGNGLEITQDGTEIFSTDDDDEVDEGSVLVTTNNAEFELTVSRGSRSDTCLIEAESPAGQVLGEQVSVVPLGAAAAGGGGAAPLAPTAGQTIVLLLGQAIRLVRNES